MRALAEACLLGAYRWIHRTGSIGRGPDCGRLPKKLTTVGPHGGRPITISKVFMLLVLVTSPSRESSCRELCNTPGENVTATKHGFEPGLARRLRSIAGQGGERCAESGAQCSSEGTAGVGPPGNKSRWGHQVVFIDV